MSTILIAILRRASWRGLFALTLILAWPGSQGVARAQAPSVGLGFTRDFTTSGPGAYVYALAEHDDGTGRQLYMGGAFTNVSGQQMVMSNYITRWNGSTWDRVGWGFFGDYPWQYEPSVRALAVFDGGGGPQLYAGGWFNWTWQPGPGWVNQGGLARWDGAQWWPLGTSPVLTLAVFDDGSGEALYAGGIGYLGNDGSGGGWPSWIMAIGRWDGQAWSRVGAANALNVSQIDKLAVLDDGSGPQLYAAGNFTAAEGQPASGLASWNGSNWTGIQRPLTGEGSDTVQAMASYDDGSGPALFLADLYRLWRFQGGTWSQVQFSGYNRPMVRAMHVYDDGNGPALFVSGEAMQLPGLPPNQFVHLARWDGIDWTRIGAPRTAGNAAAWSMTVSDLGQGPDLYMGGVFGPAGGFDHRNMARYRGVHRSIAPVCGGDGSLTMCPCSRPGHVGHGCSNSVWWSGARLQASGATADDSIAFDALALPPSTPCLLFQGSAYDYASSFTGAGVTCTSGNLGRLFTKTAQNGVVVAPGPNDPSLRARANALGDRLASGAVRYYQIWYRDPDPGFCRTGGLFNSTNGMRVVW